MGQLRKKCAWKSLRAIARDANIPFILNINKLIYNFLIFKVIFLGYILKSLHEDLSAGKGRSGDFLETGLKVKSISN